MYNADDKLEYNILSKILRQQSSLIGRITNKQETLPSGKTATHVLTINYEVFDVISMYQITEQAHGLGFY